MAKIVVHRTYIAIEDYNLGDNKSLEYSLSIFDKTYHKFEHIGYNYDAANRILKIPRGVSVQKLENGFHSIAQVDYNFTPYYNFATPIGLKYSPRDNDQLEAIKFIVGMGKYQINKKKSMLSLNLNTGKGKTYCTIASIAYMGLTSMVISPMSDLMDQWINFFIEYTDIDPKRIYRIAGSPSIDKLFTRSPGSYDIYICSHDTLNSYGKNNGWQTVNELFAYLGIGVKVFDEAHLNFENMFAIDCSTHVYKTLYLTATMGRSDREEDQIFQTYFNGTPYIDLFHEDTDPHTSYIAIKYNSKPSPLDIEGCINGYGLKRYAYTNYVVDQPNFECILYILMEKIMKSKGKWLIYVGTNEAIIKVRDWIYTHYPSMVGLVGIYTSIVDPEVKANQLNKPIILSTTKSAGAAMDIKGLVKTVNLAEPFRSRVLAQQTLGRTRADKTQYLDIVDLGFDQTRRFYNFKKPIFNKYALDCKEIILSDRDLYREKERIEESRKNLWSPIVFEDDCKFNES